MIRYSLLRLFIFFAVLMILYIVGLREWVLLIASALVSSIISLLTLNGPREQFASQIETKVKKRQEKAEAFRTAEDDDEDEPIVEHPRADEHGEDERTADSA